MLQCAQKTHMESRLNALTLIDEARSAFGVVNKYQRGILVHAGAPHRP